MESQVPGIYTRSIEIGNNVEEDVLNGFFKNSNTQIDMVCATLTADEKLKNGFNVIGFSQGGQFWYSCLSILPISILVQVSIQRGEMENSRPGLNLCFQTLSWITKH